MNIPQDTDTFAGWRVTVEVGDKVAAERFVTPAALSDHVAQMVKELLDTDPQDEFAVRIKWVMRGARPLYV